MKIMYYMVAVFLAVALLCSCNSKDKEIERLKAEIEATKQKEIASAKEQLEIARAKEEKESERLKAEIEAAKQKEIAAARTQLELARAKGSLEEVFLALKTLQALGGVGEEASKEIEQTKRAIELLNTLRIAKGEHRHEDVVHIASDLLDLFSENAEARRDLKESGLIFRYLEASLDYQQKCFAADRTNEVQQVSVKADHSEKEKLDFAKIAFNVKKAREMVEEAVKLDPQYDEALAAKKSLRQMQNTIGFLMSDRIFKLVNAQRPMLTKVFTVFNSGLQDAAALHGSPQKIWNNSKHKSLRDSLEADFDELMSDIEENASFLGQIEAADISTMTMTAKESAVLLTRLKTTVFSPRGNLNDYKADYLAVDSEFSKLVDRYNSSRPNAEAVVSDLAGFAKTLVGYKLFKKPDETRKVLQKHEKLITSA